MKTFFAFIFSFDVEMRSLWMPLESQTGREGGGKKKSISPKWKETLQNFAGITLVNDDVYTHIRMRMAKKTWKRPLTCCCAAFTNWSGSKIRLQSERLFVFCCLSGCRCRTSTVELPPSTRTPPMPQWRQEKSLSPKSMGLCRSSCSFVGELLMAAFSLAFT